MLIRPPVDHMFKGESLVRAARRGVIKAKHPTPDPIRLAASAMIDDAIAHLVAARAALNADEETIPAEPVPDLRLAEMEHALAEIEACRVDAAAARQIARNGS